MKSDPNSSLNLPRTSNNSMREAGLMRNVARKGALPDWVCRFTSIMGGSGTGCSRKPALV